ncbi:uncharacterized protein CEXT_339801 [Caerostris extrusa]|uniref:Uncharacterized protein n=1 Tax=Caerostris extrusa TaxID=172846 RepID=A0AAV4XIT1_CAEEX|nr:uncharacterized protein CEXT_339801 [Caerostris extrusa]
MSIQWKVERYQVIKPKDNLVLQKGEFASQTTNLSEFQQYQQQSKPEIVIRRDNLHQEGSVDYNTTHKTEFGKTTSVERPHVVKPKGNLELEKGKFASESTTHYEFQQKQQQPKQKIVTRKDNLHQEGSVDFTTTNQTQFGQNVDSVERYQVIKPKDNLVLQKGEFASQTTNLSEFQQYQQQSKPEIVIRRDNLHQEGSVDYNTTHKTEFGKTISVERPHVTTNLSEFQQYQQQSKPEIVIRRDNLHQEGSVDYNTTHKTEFGKTTSVERPHVVKPKGNLELEKGKFASESTTHYEFQQKQQQPKQKIVTRKDNLHQEGSVDFTTTNQTQFGQNVDSVERYQVIKPKDNLVLQKTTNLSEFQQYQQQSKPEIVIRRDNLHQEGSVDYNTTHKTEFGKTTSVERPHVVKPKGNLELEKGKFASESTTHYEFQQKQQQPKQKIVTRKDNLYQEGSVDFTTTNQTQFGQNVDSVERYQVIKPKDNLVLQKGEFASQTTNLSEFQQYQQQSKPEIVIRRDNLHQEGSVDYNTTHKTEFGKLLRSKGLM